MINNSTTNSRKLNKYIIFILFIIILAVFWVVVSKQVEPQSLSQVDQNNVSNNTDKARAVLNGKVFVLEVMDTPDKQREGLSGRDSIGQGQAMLFVFDQAKIMDFWMKDMKFNIDLLWIKGDEIGAWEKKVLAPDPNLSDNKLKRYTSPFPVDKVLELKSGTIDDLSLKINDKVELLNLPNNLNN